MSHIARVQVNVTNLDDLAAACRRIGLELVRGRTEYGWCKLDDTGALAYQRRSECQHAICLPEAAAREAMTGRASWIPHSLGVGPRSDGQPGYELLYEDSWDSYTSALMTRVGPGCRALSQSYSAVAAIRTAQQQGFAVVEQPLPNGKIKLAFRK